MRDGALIAAEEEQLVLDDGAADDAAELIALQRVAVGGEIVLGVEVVVAEEVEDRAVEGIGSGARDDVDDRAGMEAVLRGEAGGLHAEFLNGIGEWERQVHVGERVGVVGAVHQVLGLGALAAGDGERDFAGIVLGADVVARGRGGGGAGKQNQVRRLPAVEGNVDHALRVDDLRYGLILGLHHGGRGVHLDGLGGSAHFEADVNAQVVADLDDDAGLHEGLKSLLADAELIRSHGKVGKAVSAVGSAGDGALQSGVGLGGFDLGAGDDSSIGVGDGALDLAAADRLGMQSRGGCEKEK